MNFYEIRGVEVCNMHHWSVGWMPLFGSWLEPSRTVKISPIGEECAQCQKQSLKAIEHAINITSIQNFLRLNYILKKEQMCTEIERIICFPPCIRGQP